MLLQGTLIGWGYNSYFTLGIGNIATNVWPPVMVAGNYSWTSLPDSHFSRFSCGFLASEFGGLFSKWW